MLVLAAQFDRLQMEAALRKILTLCQLQHVELNTVLLVPVDMFW